MGTAAAAAGAPGVAGTGVGGASYLSLQDIVMQQWRQAAPPPPLYALALGTFSFMCLPGTLPTSGTVVQLLGNVQAGYCTVSGGYLHGGWGLLHSGSGWGYCVWVGILQGRDGAGWAQAPLPVSVPHKAHGSCGLMSHLPQYHTTLTHLSTPDQITSAPTTWSLVM